MQIIYDSLHHAAGAVGINTSAMIEAAIAGTPVFTIKASEFDDTQTGTVHFRYLLQENGGAAQAADSLDEHVLQLRDSRVLSDHGSTTEPLQRFVASFVRPKGIEQAGVPLVADAIERAATTHHRSGFPGMGVSAARAALGPRGLMLLADRERLSASLEVERLVSRSSLRWHRCCAASRSLKPGRTPIGELMRARRPGVAIRLDQAARKPERTGRTYLKRWVAHERARAGADPPKAGA